MFKKLMKNTVCSFLFLFLMSVIFTYVGIVALELFKSFSVVVIAVVFGALLFLAYVIGGRLHYTGGMSFVSIILLPVLMCVVTYALCIIAIPYISMMLQYPGAIWVESLNLRSDDHGVMIYALDVLYYLISSLALLVGAYKKSKA